MTKAEIKKELTFQTPDEVGVLARVTETLAKRTPNVVIPHAYGKKGAGVFRVVTPNNRKTIEAIKSLGYEVTADDVVAVKLDNKPGEGARVTRKIAQAGISITYAHSYSVDDGKEAMLVLKTDDNQKALKALNA